MAEHRSRTRDRAPWWTTSTTIAPTRRDRLGSALPLVLASTMAIAINVTGAAEPAHAAPAGRGAAPKASAVDRGRTVREAIADARVAVTAAASAAAAVITSAAAPPATITVAAGDTVSDIAARYGLSTPTVLALNGLSWSSLIHPGQVLKLTASGPVAEVQPATSAAAEVRRHTIAAGETISGIAATYGVSTASVLTANGLGWSSLIFPGQTVVIPDAGDATVPTAAAPTAAAQSTATEPTPAPDADTPQSTEAPQSDAISADTALLDDAQRANATTIIAVGRDLGVPDTGIVIALAAAAQESSLRNLEGGDRDSVGLFQQRPSTGWGTADELGDPETATRLFFGGPTGPNVGTRGLLDIDGWASLTLAEAAQAVQISAHPEAYARWESAAWSWLADLG